MWNDFKEDINATVSNIHEKVDNKLDSHSDKMTKLEQMMAKLNRETKETRDTKNTENTTVKHDTTSEEKESTRQEKTQNKNIRDIQVMVPTENRFDILDTEKHQINEENKSKGSEARPKAKYPVKTDKPLIIHDSIGRDIRAAQLLPTKYAQKRWARDIEGATKVIVDNHKTLPREIIIITGANDLSQDDEYTFKEKLCVLVESTIEAVPDGKIWLSNLLPRPGLWKKVQTINNMINELETVYTNLQIIDIFKTFRGRSGWFRDQVHPNRIGMGKLVLCIREAVTNGQPSRSYQPSSPACFSNSGPAKSQQDSHSLNWTNKPDNEYVNPESINLKTKH